MLDANDIGDYADAIHDIYKRKYDGILVKNAIAPEVCDQIVENAGKLSPELIAEMPVGWTSPPIFAALIGKVFRNGEEEGRKAMKRYFQECERFFHDSSSYFGADTTAFIEHWLGAFSGGRKLVVPKGYDDQGIYTNTTCRGYKGNGEGNISVHCGNYFQTTWKQFYGHLEQQVDVYDQLSYFFMLQQPESGGELSLFDFEWEDGQSKVSNHENKIVTMADGSAREIEGGEIQYIDPQKGDLILFAGGQIWHRVEQVMGNHERVTIGGFLSFNYEKDAVCYWS